MAQKTGKNRNTIDKFYTNPDIVGKYIEKFNSINNQLKFKFIIYDEESPDFYEVSKLISDFENFEKIIEKYL